jgi:hypothetical protein
MRIAFVHRSKMGRSTSALGQKQKSDSRLVMSALPPKADIGAHDHDVRFVPRADIGCYSITSSARA